MWAPGAPAQAAPEYTEAERATRAARAAACPVARGQPDRSEYDEWGRHKDYVEPVESDDGLGGSIHGSTDEMLGLDEPEDDTSSLDLSDTEIEPRSPQRCVGTAPPELTEEQLASRGPHEWAGIRGQAARQPTDDGLGGSIKGSTIHGPNWRDQEQPPIPKHEPAAKERPLRRLCNPQTARDKLESIMDGRIYHLDFPETPMRYVGMTASCVTAIRDEPGRTLLRQYMLPRLKNQRGNPLARVDTEAGFLARFLFEENPKAAKKRLVDFLEETCDGEHDVPEVTEIIKQFEPFDIKLSTLVRMLDAIFEQGNTHAAQICQLRTDNRKQATLIESQGDQLTSQGEQLMTQGEQLATVLERHQEQEEKLDLVLAMLHSDQNVTAVVPPKSPRQSPPAKKSRPQEQACRQRIPVVDNAKRDAERHASRKATKQILLQHFVFGAEVSECESVSTEAIMAACTESNPEVSATAVGRALKSLGAEKRRQAHGTAYFNMRRR
jgi:hypothetical protein